MSAAMCIAAAAWCCLILGYLSRRNRKRHVPLVLAGIFLDVSLVIYLQLTRDAIQTALSFTLSTLEQIHIATSTTALLLYLPVMYFGFKLLRGDRTPATRSMHIRLAVLALFFRTVGFAFMFSMWGKNP